jgi:hypothetical protein
MNDEFGKDVEGSGRGLIKVVSRDLPGGTDDNNEKPKSG